MSNVHKDSPSDISKSRSAIAEFNHELEARADAALNIHPASETAERPMAGRLQDGRFAKGTSGNPAGRPRKTPPETLSLAEIMDELLDETRTVERRNGTEVVTLRRLYVEKILVRAMDKKTPIGERLKLAELLKPKAAEKGQQSGVLVVPGMANKDDWERDAAIHQARYRGNCGADPDDE